MKALFVELPPFERYRSSYLDDVAYGELQNTLMANPWAGDLISGTGGLRKLRWLDNRRGKGKRGGMRVIYFFWNGHDQFWLFTLYDKDEMNDLSSEQRAQLKQMIKAELEARQ